MIDLLQPAFLGALAALIVPLAIHLWSRGTPRRVAVGSVRFVERVAVRRARRLRLTDVPLLLVRCLFVALLALLLTEPVWRTEEPPAEPERWLLIGPEVLHGEPPIHLDELRAGADAVRWLLPGLPEASTDSPPDVPLVDVWTELAELAMRLPPGSAVDVLAVPLATRFTGQRPTLPLTVRWHAPTPQAASATWLHQAGALPGDSLRLVWGDGSGDATRYRGQVLARSELDAVGVELREQRDGLQLREKRTRASGRWLSARPGPDTLVVAAYAADDRAVGTRYVRAAIESAAQALDRPVRWDEVMDASAVAEADVYVWLADAAVPDAWRQPLWRGGVLLRDAAGPSADAAERVRVEGHTVTIHRRTVAPTAGVPLWRGAAGEPVLAEHSVGEGRVLAFASRFDPAWTDLVVQPAFPLWMVDVLRSADLGDDQEQRWLDEAQVLPRAVAPADVRATSDARPLHRGLWLVLVAVGLVERWWAARRDA